MYRLQVPHIRMLTANTRQQLPVTPQPNIRAASSQRVLYDSSRMRNFVLGRAREDKNITALRLMEKEFFNNNNNNKSCAGGAANSASPSSTRAHKTGLYYCWSLHAAQSQVL